MKISLENYLRNKINKIDEVESMHSFEIATDTIRCWIDDYNEQLSQYNVSGQSEQFDCYEIWRPNIPDNGCKTQCKECAEKQKQSNCH